MTQNVDSLKNGLASSYRLHHMVLGQLQILKAWFMKFGQKNVCAKFY